MTWSFDTRKQHRSIPQSCWWWWAGWPGRWARSEPAGWAGRWGWPGEWAEKSVAAAGGQNRCPNWRVPSTRWPAWTWNRQRINWSPVRNQTKKILRAEIATDSKNKNFSIEPIGKDSNPDLIEVRCICWMVRLELGLEILGSNPGRIFSGNTDFIHLDQSIGGRIWHNGAKT